MNNLIHLFVNPFEKTSDRYLLIYGILLLFAGTFFAYLNGYHYPDMLSIKKVPGIPLQTIFIQNTSYTILLTLILFILGRVSYAKTRLIDILNVVMVSRSVFYWIVILNFFSLSASIDKKIVTEDGRLIENHIQNLTNIDITVMLIIGILAILLMVYSFYLMLTGYRIAINSKRKLDGLWAFLAYLCSLIISLFI